MDIINDLAELIIRITMWVLIIRFWLQWAAADFYNPLAQTIVKLSEPLCRPLRKLLPQSRKYDWSALVVTFLLAMLRWLIYFSIIGIQYGDLNSLIVRSFFLVLDVAMMVLFFMLIIRAIASWIVGSQYHPGLQVIVQLTDPLLRPIRKIFPPTSGIDFSPMILMLLVWLIMRIIAKI